MVFDDATETGEACCDVGDGAEEVGCGAGWGLVVFLEKGLSVGEDIWEDWGGVECLKCEGGGLKRWS